jgi:flagellar M-ring protein FliF
MIAKIKSITARWLPAVAKLPSAALTTRLVPLVVLALALTALAMLYIRHLDSEYKPLFGAQEKIVAADAMAVLDAEGIPYRLHPETGQVLIPESDLGKARMLLAAKGVVAKLPAGLEVVDKSDPLGVSQFVQDVRFRRGLEGELEQSIMALDPVASARVHLSVAKSSSFILSDGDKSSASVVVTLKPDHRLRPEQVSAIVALVSGSTANLDPSRVSVIDQAGNYLSASIDPSNPGAGDSSELAVRTREETLSNIRDLLAPSMGADGFRASVAVDVDQDRIEETHEQLGDAPRLTQEATREENDSGNMPLGVPGSLSNRPPVTPPAQAGAAAGAAAAAAGPRSQRNAISRQYAYDRNVVKIKRNPVRIKRLSVAVVLNNAAAPNPATGWTPAQVADIERILRSGIGIDAQRKDALVVSTLKFRPTPEQLAPPWWRNPENLVLALPYLGYTLLAIVGFFFVVRPVMGMLRQWTDANVGQAEPALLPADPLIEATLVPGARSAGSGAPTLLEGLPTLPPVGSEVDVLIDHLRVLAEQAPERVAEVLKPWIRKHG